MVPTKDCGLVSGGVGRVGWSEVGLYACDPGVRVGWVGWSEAGLYACPQGPVCWGWMAGCWGRPSPLNSPPGAQEYRSTYSTLPAPPFPIPAPSSPSRFGGVIPTFAMHFHAQKIEGVVRESLR